MKWSFSCISSTTWGVAVAVKANTGTSGNKVLMSAIFIYEGLKSYPHWEMQWASSTTNRETFIAFTLDRKRSFERRSGEMYKNLYLPNMQFSNVTIVS